MQACVFYLIGTHLVGLLFKPRGCKIFCLFFIFYLFCFVLSFPWPPHLFPPLTSHVCHTPLGCLYANRVLFSVSWLVLGVELLFEFWGSDTLTASRQLSVPSVEGCSGRFLHCHKQPQFTVPFLGLFNSSRLQGKAVAPRCRGSVCRSPVFMQEYEPNLIWF